MKNFLIIQTIVLVLNFELVAHEINRKINQKFVLSTDFLYWDADQSGMTFARNANFFENISVPPLTATQSLIESELDVDFQFKPGIKISLEFQPTHDDFSIQATWTNLNTKATGASNNPNKPGGAVAIPYFEVPQPQNNNGINAAAFWSAHYNTLDLGINREIFLNKSMDFKAHMGLRNLWMKQGYDVFSLNTWDTATPPTRFMDAKSQMIQNIHGIGPILAISSTCNIYRKFNLLAQASFALIRSHIYSSNIGTILANVPTITLNKVASFHTTLPEAGLLIGGQCNFTIKNKHQFSARICWDFQTLFNTNYLGAGYQSNGNFNLSGLTTGFSFDF